MTGVSIAKVAMDRNLTDGAIALELARAGAHAQGTARVDGIPIKLDATVPFRVRGGPRAIYRIGMTLDVEARRRLGLDFDARLTGPIGVDVTYSRFEAARAQAVANLDLRAASLAIDEAGWKKSPDTPGTAKLVIELDHDRITQLSDVEVKSAGLDGRLAVAVSEDGKQVERVDIRRMVAGDNDFSGTVTRHPGGGWHADIHAIRIDGRKLIKEAASGSGPASPIPLAVTARIDRLTLGPHQEIGQITGELLRRGGIWQSARLDGRLPNGHKLALRLGDAASRQFNFETDDLGATLKLLGVADNVIGGRLAINGQLSSSAGAQTMQGHIEGANYSVARAPVMARVLALPSFTGILSMLSGDGLPFGTLRGDFTLSGGRVTIKNLLAFGEAIGITANGWVDTERDRLDLARHRRARLCAELAARQYPAPRPAAGRRFAGHVRRELPPERVDRRSGCFGQSVECADAGHLAAAVRADRRVPGAASRAAGGQPAGAASGRGRRALRSGRPENQVGLRIRSGGRGRGACGRR